MANLDASNSVAYRQMLVNFSLHSISGFGSMKLPKISTKKLEDHEVQKDISVNVGHIDNSTKAVKMATLESQRESLPEKPFDLEIRHINCDDNVDMQELVRQRISQIDKTCKQVDKNLGVSANYQKRIRFSNVDIRTTKIAAGTAMRLSIPPSGTPFYHC